MLAERLKLLRLEHDLPLAEVAEGAGVCIETVRRAEMGLKLNERTEYKLAKYVERKSPEAMAV